MKREGNLISKCAEMENLRVAFFKARKGKEGKPEVINFQKNLNDNLTSLNCQILNGKLLKCEYRKFIIFEPKERIICASPFRYRVIQHAIMNVCHNNFDKYQINDSYASRKNKGTYAAINKALENMRKYAFCLKLDVRKYFDSIDHSILFELLKRRFKDEKILSLFKNIIFDYNDNNVGLPIGNLSSQYFANHYLGVADHYLIEKLKALACVRYMDDILIWDNSKENLLKIGKMYKKYIYDALNLELKIFSIHPTIKGCKFLGYKLFPYRLELCRESKIRFYRKMKHLYDMYNNGIWSEWEMNKRLTPLLAFVDKADSYYYKKNVMAKIE